MIAAVAFGSLAASSLRTQKTRRASAASLTAALTSRRSVAATTYQAASRSASSKPRRTQVSSPLRARPSIAGLT